MAGQWAYLAFLAWITIGVLWHAPARDADVIKAIFVCGLAAPVAAQILIAGRSAQIIFAAAVTLSLALSIWMILQALSKSGFQYRTGRRCSIRTSSLCWRHRGR